MCALVLDVGWCVAPARLPRTRFELSSSWRIQPSSESELEAAGVKDPDGTLLPSQIANPGWGDAPRQKLLLIYVYEVHNV